MVGGDCHQSVLCVFLCAAWHHQVNFLADGLFDGVYFPTNRGDTGVRDCGMLVDSFYYSKIGQ